VTFYSSFFFGLAVIISHLSLSLPFPLSLFVLSLRSFLFSPLSPLQKRRTRKKTAKQPSLSPFHSLLSLLSLSLSLSISLSIRRFVPMSLKECAPWLFGRVFSSSKGREISSSEALAVQRLFSSLLSKAEAEAEKEAKSQEVWHSWSSPTAVHCHACKRAIRAICDCSLHGGRLGLSLGRKGEGL